MEYRQLLQDFEDAKASELPRPAGGNPFVEPQIVFYEKQSRAMPFPGEYCLLACLLLLSFESARAARDWVRDVLPLQGMFDLKPWEFAVSGNSGPRRALRESLSGRPEADIAAAASFVYKEGHVKELPSVKDVRAYLDKIVKLQLEGPVFDGKGHCRPRFVIAI